MNEDSSLVISRTRGLHNRGVSLCNENPLFMQLARLMSDPLHRAFLKDQFASWSDVKVFVMYVKAYECLVTEFELQTGSEPTTEEVCVLLRHMMTESHVRRFVVECMQQFVAEEASPRTPFIDFSEFKRSQSGKEKELQ
jgi:hypothetical protein